MMKRKQVSWEESWPVLHFGQTSSINNTSISLCSSPTGFGLVALTELNKSLKIDPFFSCSEKVTSDYNNNNKITFNVVVIGDRRPIGWVIAGPSSAKYCNKPNQNEEKTKQQHIRLQLLKYLNQSRGQGPLCLAACLSGLQVYKAALAIPKTKK